MTGPTTTRMPDDPTGDLDALLSPPGSSTYDHATAPRNATATQTPAAVAAVHSPRDVALCVRWAAQRGLTVQVQATGHGAAGPVGPGTLLVDTSALDDVAVDPVRSVARVGAGASWARVNAAAAQYGLIGPAGTAPDVGAAGYVFYGGIGWTTRPDGLAAGALRAVEFVDGLGRPRHADADDDTDAFWAFRGGGGVGIATEIEIALRPADDLWGGYLLWPAADAARVAHAWGDGLGRLHPALSTALGLLRQAPGAPDVPGALRGRPAVHLSAASVEGADAVTTLRKVLDGLPMPTVDTLGPCDAERLAGIHLDPPAAVPALGEGRWLHAVDGADAAAILLSAGATLDSPLSEVELRHMPAPAPNAPFGAQTAPTGEILLHAVGPAPDTDRRTRVEDGLDLVRAAADRCDTGRSAASFRDGRDSAPGALRVPDRRRLASIRRAVDPHSLLAVPRPLDGDADAPEGSSDDGD